MSDQIRLREWSGLAFRDPEELIRKFNALERFVAGSSIQDSEKALRTNGLKTLRETRQAALFALGLRKWAGNASVEIAAIPAGAMGRSQQAADRTGEVSCNISGVTAGTAETGSAAREVLASAVNLAQQSETLRAEVNRFLSSIRAA